MSMYCLSVIHIPKTKTLRAVILLALALGAASLSAEGQVFWQEGGVSVRDSTLYRDLEVVPDGSGGAIVVWTDTRWRPTASRAIYAQRIDSSGVRIWPDSGVAACLPLEEAYWLAAVPDGAGGVVVYWQWGSFRLCAQRLDGNGTRPWSDSSVVVFDTTSYVIDLDGRGMCSDGRCGCVVLWAMNYYNDDSIVLRAQHIDSLGQQAWGSRGRRIAQDVALYGSAGVVGVGTEGFAFTWMRDNGEIYAQRLDTAGNPIWSVPVCSGVSVLGYPIITRADGGVLVCWTDMRNGDWDVYAQKLNLAGNPLWAQNGVPVCRAEGQQGGWVDYSGEWIKAVGLPDGGALVAFSDRGRGRTAVSCQRLSADGHVMWDSSGVEAGRIMDRDSLFSWFSLGLVPDTAGGAIVTWPRYLPSDTSQIWAQHLDTAGSACWDSGVCISQYQLAHDLPLFRAADVNDGVIACWQDLRFDRPYWSVYVQRYGDAPTGLAEPHVNSPPAARWVCPNPVRTSATISLPPCGEQSVALELFDACGQKVCCLWQGPGALPCAVRWTGIDDTGRRLPAGVYFLRLVAGGRLVANQLVTVVR